MKRVRIVMIVALIVALAVSIEWVRRNSRERVKTVNINGLKERLALRAAAKSSLREKLISQGRTNLQFPSELESLIGVSNVVHKIHGGVTVPLDLDWLLGESNANRNIYGVKFPLESSLPQVVRSEWRSEGFFGGGYNIEIVAPILMDRVSLQITNDVGPITAYLREVSRVETRPEGVKSISYSKQWTIDESQWKRVVSNQGDWASVDIHLNTNRMVEHFEKLIRAADPTME